MQLSLVIVNYKMRGLLKQCLKGLLTKPIALEHEIIVIDNASHDGTAAMMAEEFPFVTFIQSPRNGGFAYGVNQGIARATGDYVLVMNPDIAVLGTPFVEMFRYMEEHPDVGLCAPKLLNPDGSVQTSCREFQTPSTILYRRSPLGKLPFARKRLRKFLMIDWDHASNKEVDWVLGACMMARRSAIEKVGALDERFFLYFEDMDWCRRFWAAGYHVMYLGGTTEIIHYHRRQSAESPGFAGIFSYVTRIHIRSAIKYFQKYRGVPLPHHSPVTTITHQHEVHI